MMNNMRSPFYVQFGTRVKQRRIEAGLSQADLAERCGVERSAVSRVESGRQGVQLHVLAVLTRALGCTADDLLFGNNVSARPDAEDPFVARMKELAQTDDGSKS